MESVVEKIRKNFIQQINLLFDHLAMACNDGKYLKIHTNIQTAKKAFNSNFTMSMCYDTLFMIRTYREIIDKKNVVSFLESPIFTELANSDKNHYYEFIKNIPQPLMDRILVIIENLMTVVSYFEKNISVLFSIQLLEEFDYTPLEKLLNAIYLKNINVNHVQVLSQKILVNYDNGKYFEIENKRSVDVMRTFLKNYFSVTCPKIEVR